MRMLLACSSMDLDLSPGWQLLLAGTALLWLACLVAIFASPMLMAMRADLTRPKDILLWVGAIAFGATGWGVQTLTGVNSELLVYSNLWAAPALPILHAASVWRRNHGNTRAAAPKPPATAP